MNKKGQDGLYAVVIAAIMLIMIPVFSLIMNTTTDALQGATNNTEFINSSDRLNDGWQNSADSLYVIIFFGLWIISYISAFFTRSHVIFLIAGIVVMIIAILFGAVFTNAFFDTIATQSPFVEELADMPMANFIANYFVEINLFLFVLWLILLYAVSPKEY